MPLVSTHQLIRAARAGWRYAPATAFDSVLVRLRQGLAALHGYGIECLDDEVAVACRELPTRPAVIFDVGAHKGAWSLGVLSRRSGASDRYFLFEPSAVNIKILNGLSAPEFRIVPLAVSDKCMAAPLYSDAAGSGLASLQQRDLASYGLTHEKQEEVRTTTLDDFVECNAVDHIDYLKLDIEGHELSALHGAERLLREHRISALSFEFGGTHVDSRVFLRDYWNLLTARGYLMHRIVPGGVLLPMRLYDVALEVFRLSTYVALATRP